MGSGFMYVVLLRQVVRFNILPPPCQVLHLIVIYDAARDTCYRQQLAIVICNGFRLQIDLLSFDSRDEATRYRRCTSSSLEERETDVDLDSCILYSQSSCIFIDFNLPYLPLGLQIRGQLTEQRRNR